MSIEIRFDKNFAYDGVRVFVFVRNADRTLTPLKITVEASEKVHEGGIIPASTILRHHEEKSIFRALVEGLQEFGVLPKASHLEGELKATKEYLEFLKNLINQSSIQKEKA